MSVRLRLTLVYTVILALTLAILGGVLYGTQLQSMRRGGERVLQGIAIRLVQGVGSGQLPRGEVKFPPRPGGGEPHGERRFGIPATYWQVSSADGEVTARSPNLEDVTLVLPDRAQAALERLQPWSGPVTLGADRLLVYAVPVVEDGALQTVVQVAHSIGEQEEYLATLRRNLVIGSGVAVLLAFASGWMISGYVLRPVGQITQTAQAIGAERNFGRRVQYDGPQDEIGELATTFNAMLGELEAAYRQQQQFVADVSHELRTPLTTIRGNLELLRRDPPVSDDDRREVLSDVTTESERLIRLVSDLLLLARADARQSLHTQAVPIGPMIEDVCRQGRLLAPDRSIRCDALPDLAVSADRDGLKQVLLILVDNAIRHTRGPITVSGARGGQSVQLRVANSGPGMSPDVLARVFERFYRADRDEVAAEPGLGLGLPIARALVEAQGGRLSVESDVETGSVFTLELPFADALGAA